MAKSLQNIINPPKKCFIVGHSIEALHFCYQFLMVANILFCEEIWMLIVLLNILFLNIAGIVMFKRCPLELIVKKHCGDCVSDEVRKWFEQLDFLDYQCDHIYENHLQILGSVYGILSTKIMLLIMYKTWKQKIF
jgi:hypothetical protein